MGSDRGAGIRLVAGERIIMTSNDSMLTLTSHRVRLDSRVSGQSRYISMTLEAIASCGLITRTRPLLLLLAAAAGIFGLAQSANDVRFGLILFAVLLAVAYLLTRTAVLKISSMGGESILLPARGMGREAIVEFLEELEQAKLDALQSGRIRAAGAA